MHQFVDINGKPFQERFVGVGRTSVILRRGNKAIKVLRRLDTANMTEQQCLVEKDRLELCEENIENEKLIYKDIGRYPSILEVEFSSKGIKMLYLTNGSLDIYLHKHCVD
jgi:hypothetical protein